MNRVLKKTHTRKGDKSRMRLNFKKHWLSIVLVHASLKELYRAISMDLRDEFPPNKAYMLQLVVDIQLPNL